MHDLKMPDSLPGFRVQGEHAIREQILAMTFTSIEIRLGRLRRDGLVHLEALGGLLRGALGLASG